MLQFVHFFLSVQNHGIGKDFYTHNDLFQEKQMSTVRIETTQYVRKYVNFAKENPISDKYLEKVEKIATSNVLTVDLKYMFIKNIMKDAKRKFQKLLLKESILDLTSK